ncbi:MAG: chemotaxis protein CheD [Candidatus Omnitrophota bacterium]
MRQEDKTEKEFIDVDTGEVKVTSEPVVLQAMAIGSCVAVVVFDRGKKIGGLAHIMLPGRSPEKESKEKPKYTEDAVDELLEKLKNLGAKTEDLEISLVGGADLLGEGNIAELIVNSVLDYLKRLGIKLKQQRLGGTQRRSISLDISSGKIVYTEGDSTGKELC